MTPDIILHILITYKYWIFVPMALLVGGPVVALLAGLLTSLGYLEILPTYGMLILCDLIPDTIYYLLGRHTNAGFFVEKYGKKIGLGEHGLSHLETLWRKHTFKSMLFSKWAYGFSTPLLMSAGMAHLPFRRYLLYTVSITIGQYIVLFALGYSSGASSIVLINRIHNVQYVIAGILAVIIVGYIGFSLFMKRRFLREQQEHPSP